MLTAQGRELAAPTPWSSLTTLTTHLAVHVALTPMRQLQLVREVEVSSLTIKRRVSLLIGRGLVKQDAARQPFSITDAGLAALGPGAPKRWVDLNRLRASTAKDVLTRSPTETWSASQLAAKARMARGRPRGGKQALMRAMAV